MDAINSLPVQTSVASTPRPHTNAASEKDSQRGSFEALLYDKGAKADESASEAGETQRPAEVAKGAEGEGRPRADEIPALVAMLQILPMPAPQPAGQATIVVDATIPVEAAKPAGEDDQSGADGISTVAAMPPIPTTPALQLIPLPPVPATEVRVDDLTSTSVVRAPVAPLPRPAATVAIAMPFEPARPVPTAGELPAESSLDALRGPAVAAPRSVAGSATPTIDPNVKTVVLSEVSTATPTVMLPAPRGPALAPEPLAEAASAYPTNSIIDDDAVLAVVVDEAAVEGRGISSAKQEFAMPPAAKSSLPALKATASPADRSVAEFVTIPVAPQGDVRMPTSARQQNAGGGHREEKPGVLPETGDPTTPASTVTNSFVAPAYPSDVPAAIPRTQVEAIVHRTLESAERLRATGGERVEVQIKLDAGHEITVRLQITHGEIRPVFVTESHELRHALEQNWSQFSERASDRNLRITTPVFESPNSQSNMNDLNQHGREGRQRAFAEAREAAFGASIPFGRKSPRHSNAAVPAAAPATGALYA